MKDFLEEKTAQDTVAPFIKHFVEDRQPKSKSLFGEEREKTSCFADTVMSGMGKRKMKTRKANNHDVKKTHTGLSFLFFNFI